jgi:hypothetical protein
VLIFFEKMLQKKMRQKKKMRPKTKNAPKSFGRCVSEKDAPKDHKMRPKTKNAPKRRNVAQSGHTVYNGV